jgi:hypothetical protein
MSIKNRKNVFILKNKNQFKISLYADLDFSIKSLKTLKKAREYCLSNALIIKAEIFE